jgi:hypothetical protein
MIFPIENDWHIAIEKRLNDKRERSSMYFRPEG